jgi:hypothetical protein
LLEIDTEFVLAACVAPQPALTAPRIEQPNKNDLMIAVRADPPQTSRNIQSRPSSRIIEKSN